MRSPVLFTPAGLIKFSIDAIIYSIFEKAFWIVSEANAKIVQVLNLGRCGTMSIKLPEARILSCQMNQGLKVKQISSCSLKNCQRLQRIGFVNKDSSDFDRLVDARIVSVVSRGNVIKIKLEREMNLILAPEYGGRILFHSKEADTPFNYHLRLQFEDSTTLTVALRSMGLIQALRDEELEGSYVFKRDFSTTPSPLGENEFIFENFAKELATRNVNIKAALVGKDAVVVGLSNCSFQDILYRARIHPKRKASSLLENEKNSLYRATKALVEDRIRLGGKEQFVDLYGKQGKYISTMGSDRKGQECATCGSRIEKINLGGGQVYFCPTCQV